MSADTNYAFVGYGELGQQIHALMDHGSSEFIIFDDERVQSGKENALPFHSYREDKFKHYEFIVALGYLHLQKKKAILMELFNLKRRLFSFVHPSCFVNPSATIGEGSFLYPMCNIDQKTRMGAGVLVNNSVCVSHNTDIGDCCYLSPGVITSGFVEIGECTFIGTGSVISDHVKIGRNVIIGAGSVVTRDIPENSSAIGNPARTLDRPLDLRRM